MEKYLQKYGFIILKTPDTLCTNFFFRDKKKKKYFQFFKKKFVKLQFIIFIIFHYFFINFEQGFIIFLSIYFSW